MPNQVGESKKKSAASFRFEAAVHNRLRRHAKIRNVSATELLTELINELDQLTGKRAGSAHLKSAALACILALDLLKMRVPPRELIAAAASKLEDLLLHLEGGQGS